MEDVEAGTHVITVTSQPGCTVGHVMVAGKTLKSTGGQAVSINATLAFADSTTTTVFVDVECV